LQETVRSVVPIAWAWTKTTLRRLSGLAALVEIWKRIRH
jgi:hypothetical protein